MEEEQATTPEDPTLARVVSTPELIPVMPCPLVLLMNTLLPLQQVGLEGPRCTAATVR